MSHGEVLLRKIFVQEVCDPLKTRKLWLLLTSWRSLVCQKGRNEIVNTQPHFLETEKEGEIHPWPVQACLCGLRSLSWILLAGCLRLCLSFDQEVLRIFKFLPSFSSSMCMLTSSVLYLLPIAPFRRTECRDSGQLVTFL